MRLRQRRTATIDVKQPVEWKHPLNQGLVAWHLCHPQLAGTSRLYDLCNTGNYRTAGTLNGFASSTSTSGWNGGDGLFGSELRFDGTNDFVSIPNAVSFQGLLAGSISVWYRPTANPTGNPGIYYESTTSNGFTRFALYHLSTGNLQGTMRDTNTGSSFNITVTSPFTLGKWHHLVLTVNSASDNLLLYVNGVLRGTNNTAKGGFTSGNPADTIGIGAFTQTSFQSYVNGRICDVRLHNLEIPGAQVPELYNSGLLGYPGVLRLMRNVSYSFPGSSAAATDYPRALMFGAI